MTFLNDLWKKFKTPVSAKSWEDTDAIVDEVLEPSETSTAETLKKTESLLTTFQETETEYLQRDEILAKLKTIHSLLASPNSHPIDVQFDEINQHLGIPECYEALRQQRWPHDIQCPNCYSTQLRRIPQIPPESIHNHRYRCLSCHMEFNDDTGTPIEAGQPSLNVWLQCWYLLGFTDSLNYIASKLNLDLNLVEQMVATLRKLFNAQKPIVHTELELEWSEKTKQLRKQLSEDLLKQYEVLNANVATLPRDSTEFRRQQNLRRTLKATTDPASPNPNPKRR